MIKGQVVSGDFSKIIMRIKASERVEMGDLLIIEDGNESYLLQVYDLGYGSQISNQNLEMVAGMNLEESAFSLMDAALRTYQLAFLKPILVISADLKMCKKLPPFFSSVRAITSNDLAFMRTPKDPLFLGNIRSGSKMLDFSMYVPGPEVLSHHILITASTGKGKSNLMRTMLWDLAGRDYAGILVLDPHDEYYGRSGLGLKDHSARSRISYYTPVAPPVGAKTLKINLSKLKPEHFAGAIALTEPQRQCLYAYHRKYKEKWIRSILEERSIEGVQFHEDTMIVVKRKLISLLHIELERGEMLCQGIFDEVAGENTIAEMCLELEQGKMVIVDTSYFAGAIEIMVGTIVASEIFNRYKYYKRLGQLDEKPVVAIVLEEAPRVLGKKVLEEGSNIFDTLAREGRKFKVGLVAITQLPSEIPKTVLANMNTKIILGLEMHSERMAVIESAPHDLSADSRAIASLDRGEAIVSSTFTRFALPIKAPLFSDFVKQRKEEKKYVIDESLFG